MGRSAKTKCVVFNGLKEVKLIQYIGIISAMGLAVECSLAPLKADGLGIETQSRRVSFKKSQQPVTTAYVIQRHGERALYSPSIIPYKNIY